MSITLLDGGTSSTAGGTAQVFSEIGKNLTNGVVLGDTGNSDYFTREELQCSIRNPSLGSDGEWSKSKRVAKLVQPFTTAGGKVVYNLVNITVEIHPESSAAVLADLREKGAQICIDAELDTFYSLGNINL